MKNLHIENSYNIWSKAKMRSIIDKKCFENYNSSDAATILNRPYRSLYLEWWLHNIGYYLTLPFCANKKINSFNTRFRDVDLEEWSAD